MLDFIWEALLSWVQSTVLSAIDTINIDMLYAFSPRLITLDTYFPMLGQLWNVVWMAANAMIVILMFYKIFQNQFTVFSQNYESPLVLIIRAVFAGALIAVAPTLVAYLLKIADGAYWSVLQAAGFMDDGNAIENLGSTVCASIANFFANISNSVDYVEKALTDFNPTDNLVAFLLSLIFTIVIAWNYFKLALEIAERYIVIAVMFYTTPLAMVPIVSKETSQITKSWLRMFVSELMLLVLNIWFLVVFRSAILESAMTKRVVLTVNGDTLTTGGGLLFCFIAIGFLKTAQRIDSHIAAMGFTTAQLGQSVTGSVGAVVGTMAGLAMHRGAAAMTAGKTFGGGKAGIADGTSRLTGGLIGSAEEINAAKNFAKKAQSGPVTNAQDVAGIKGEHLMSMYKWNANERPATQMKPCYGDAAAEAIRGIVPGMKGRPISNAQLGNEGFMANYKDANGKDAKISFTTDKPEGISKAMRIGDMDGYLQDTGTHYNFDELNSGSMSFNDFADKYLGGNKNFLAESGAIAPEDLDGATVTSDGSDGFIIKDSDGYDMAHVTPLNDSHADNIGDNTIPGEIGEQLYPGENGGQLYRADINNDIKAPIPEGYSYAGEQMMEDGNYHDAYKTPDGGYITSDEMHAIANQNVVSNADYAGNIAFDNDTATFRDNSGNEINLDKTGWEASGDDGTYTNKFTGGTASGEEIAEHMSSPDYANQSYGGMDKSGNKLYFDNLSKESLSEEQMEGAPVYGSVEADDKAGYYNSKTGEFGTSNGNNNFGKSFEAVLDNDYSFSGPVAIKLAKAYVPELHDAKVTSATLDRDAISVNIENGTGSGGHSERYVREVGNVSSGTYEYVSTSGRAQWYKNQKGGSANFRHEEPRVYGNGYDRAKKGHASDDSATRRRKKKN